MGIDYKKFSQNLSQRRVSYYNIAMYDFGDIQHIGADHLGDMTEDAGEPFGIVLFVDIGDIIHLLPLGFGVTDIVDVKAERFCQVVKTIEL